MIDNRRVFIGLIVAIGVIFAILMVELNHSPPERLRITSSSMHPTLPVSAAVALARRHRAVASHG